MKITKFATLTLAFVFATSLMLAQNGQKTTKLPTRDALEPDVQLTVFPHVTMGNGWTTKFLLFNVSDQAIDYRLAFYDNAGQLANIKLRDRDAANDVVGTLQPRASVRFETDNANASGETQFWAALEEGSGPIAAVQTFEWNSPDGRRTSATLPISDDFTEDPIFVPFDNMDGQNTALVITNTDNITTPEAHTIVIEAFDTDGNRFFTTTRTVPSGAKPAFLLATEYPELANHRGMLRLDAQDSTVGDFAVLALQADDHGNIAGVLPFEGYFFF